MKLFIRIMPLVSFLIPSIIWAQDNKLDVEGWACHSFGKTSLVGGYSDRSGLSEIEKGMRKFYEDNCMRVGRNGYSLSSFITDSSNNCKSLCMTTSVGQGISKPKAKAQFDETCSKTCFQIKKDLDIYIGGALAGARACESSPPRATGGKAAEGVR